MHKAAFGPAQQPFPLANIYEKNKPNFTIFVNNLPFP
jgi:hypothetical protein